MPGLAHVESEQHDDRDEHSHRRRDDVLKGKEGADPSNLSALKPPLHLMQASISKRRARGSSHCMNRETRPPCFGEKRAGVEGSLRK